MRWPRLKLRWQLLLSYLPVALIPVIVIGLVVRNVAEQGLSVLVTQEAQQRAISISGLFTQHYADNGNWEKVDRLFDQLRPPRPGGPLNNQANNGQGRPPNRDPRNPLPGQILIVDTHNIVVASDNRDAQGQTVAASVLTNGAPLIVDGKQIGTLIIGAAYGILNPEGKQLLDTLSATLLITGILTTTAAVGLALWLSNLLTTPVSDLMAGVRQLATGHWPEPLKIRSHNEFADLTQAFNGMAEQLTRQAQQQRQMIADIAHDLRTPLSIIGLEIAGIRAGLQSPEEATDSLQEEVDWLQHLIDDLHTLSLMDTGQVRLDVDNTAMTPYLRELGNQWQAMATNQEKTLVCEIPPDLPQVRLDPFRMRQVFTNLLNNALQHTPKNTRIMLSACITDDQVEINVADTGPGIAPDDLVHIFDRFYRADKSRNRNRHEHGSGLGLSIAYQLAILHGGTLSVDSRLGVGTVFHVRLPIAQTQIQPTKA
jgi:signal transduction histidine kinase